MAEVKLTITAEDKASGVITSVFQKFRSTAADFFKAMVGFSAAQQAVNGVKGFAESILDVASANEQYKITLETLLGSQEAANEKFKELNDFARKTPFQIDGLMRSFIMMKSYGLEPTIDTMRILGDATAALGGGEDKMLGIARALGQISTKGRLSAQELMQLAEQGIPAYAILKERLGLTADQIERLGASGVSANAAIQALLQGMEQRFGGQMQKMQASLKGLWEELKSLWRDFISYIAEVGATDKLKEAIIRVRDFLSEAFESGKIKEWAENISISISLLVEVASESISAFTDLWDVLKSFPEGIFDYFKNLKKEISETSNAAENMVNAEKNKLIELWNVFKVTGQLILDVVAYIGTSTAAVVGTVITSIYNLFKGLWGLLEHTGELIIGIFTLDIDKIKSALAQGVQTIKDTWKGLNASGQAMIDTIWEGWEKLVKKTEASFDAVYGHIKLPSPLQKTGGVTPYGDRTFDPLESIRKLGAALDDTNTRAESLNNTLQTTKDTVKSIFEGTTVQEGGVIHMTAPTAGYADYAAAWRSDMGVLPNLDELKKKYLEIAAEVNKIQLSDLTGAGAQRLNELNAQLNDIKGKLQQFIEPYLLLEKLKSKEGLIGTLGSAFEELDRLMAEESLKVSESAKTLDTAISKDHTISISNKEGLERIAEVQRAISILSDKTITITVRTVYE